MNKGATGTEGRRTSPGCSDTYNTLKVCVLVRLLWLGPGNITDVQKLSQTFNDQQQARHTTARKTPSKPEINPIALTYARCN